MGSKGISIVAVAAMAFTLWALFLRNPEPVSSDGLSAPVAVVPDQSASAMELPVVEVPQLAEDSSPNRSALEQAAPEIIEAEPTVATPVQLPKNRPGRHLTIEVLVVDLENKPIKGAAVEPNEVDSNMDSSFMGGGTNALVTNEQGLVSIPTDIGGLARMIAKGDGFAPGASEVFEPGADAVREPVKIILTEGGSAEGQLLGIDGEPAGGIPITIHLEQWPGSIGRSWTRVMQGTITAGDGSFLFENLTPGNYSLYTHARGGLTLERVPNQRIELEVQEGQKTIVQFAQTSQSFVRVHGVVMRDSEPLAKAQIRIGWADRGRGFLRKKVKTDYEGNFTITLDEGGRYRFHISPEGRGGTVFREIEIPPVASHELEISFDTGNLSGYLLGPDGSPVEGLVVFAYGKSLVEGSGRTIQLTMSQATGAFEFPNLAEGSYKLLASIMPRSPEPAAAPKHPYLGRVELKGLEVKAGDFQEGLELRMGGAAAIDGIVTNVEGKAVSGAVVEFRGDSPVDNTLWKADKSGMFLAGGLKPGQYLVRATRQKQLSPWVSVQATMNTTHSVEGLVLQSGTLIEIEALLGGESAGHVYARIHSEDGFRFDSETLRKGKGQLGPVLPGTYTVTIQRMGEEDAEASQTLIVNGEPSLAVQIKLP